jgi:putative ABC transport system ATP-binding protein
MTEFLYGRDIVKYYGRTPALSGVTVDIDEAEILAITGPSGCGKSTLLLCLSGILRPDAGEVGYRGQPLQEWSETARAKLRRGEFGVLFQFGQLVAELPAVENIALPLLLGGVRRRDARATAIRWLQRLDIGHLPDARPGEMSGGEQQRVALARALVTQPRILFADEPTGALDSLAAEQVLGLLTNVAREQGTAVVLVTHDARVAGYADRELVLRDGVLDPTGLGLTGAGLAAGTGAE